MKEKEDKFIETEKDMLLAKAPLPHGWIDMGVGDASIVREILMSNFRSLRSWSPSRKVDYSYQGPRGLPRLVRLLESKYSQKVTVTVGAKNAIFLIFKGLKRMGYKRIITEKPHWVSFASIAEESGLEFVTDPLVLLDPKTDVVLVTSPNNPDCSNTKRDKVERIMKMGVKVIHDAVYETPVYGIPEMEDIPYDVKVFSAAKRFGLSGIRVGWAVTSWEELDSHLQQLTETVTSGACVLAQSMVADIMSMMSQSPEVEKKFYEECSVSFRANRESLVRGLGDSIDEATKSDILSKNGMFIWINANKINTNSEVRIVKGDSFGVPGMIRLSLGAISASDAFLAGQRLRRTSEV